MRSENWSLVNPAATDGYDFDAIYEKFRENSRLPELFDKMSIIEKIIDSGKIDSIKLKKALEELIATFNKTKSGSYFSMMYSIDFLSCLMRNFVWEQLSDIPVLRPLINALRKTMEETNIERDRIDFELKDAMRKKFERDFPPLPHNEKKALPETQAARAVGQIEHK